MLEHLLEALRLVNHTHQKLDRIEERLEIIMAGIAELNAAIAALPEAVTVQVVDVVKPLIAAAGQPIDTQPQIDALAQVPTTVAQQVAAALAPTPPAV